jgi:TM2 domain-containing membrane protein YozV
MADPIELQMLSAMRDVPEPRRLEFQMSYASQRKDRTTALLLSIFLGAFGVDRFYLGHVGLGVCKLLFGWTTCGLWAFVDIFVIMSATDSHNLAVLRRLRANIHL